MDYDKGIHYQAQMTLMAIAFSKLGYTVYPGTVTRAEKARRRAANKAARAARKANR